MGCACQLVSKEDNDDDDDDLLRRQLLVKVTSEWWILCSGSASDVECLSLLQLKQHTCH